MIYNILLLLAANVFIPLIPVPPALFLGYCGYEYYSKQLTVYDDMNLTRHYSDEEFRKSFRDSLKRLHPDRGGTQQSFARVKGIKQIMQKPINYYDLYNVTHIDLSFNQQLKQVVNMKQLLYYFETTIFYFIALLYIVAFTIDDHLKPSRWIQIPMVLAFSYYEFCIHEQPQSTTILDLFSDKMPIFIQSTMIKRVFCILSALIRTYFIRIKNKQTILLQQIQKLPIIKQYQLTSDQITQRQTEQENKNKKQLYLTKLKDLHGVFLQKVHKMEADKKSWSTKIRNWIVKGFSFFILGLMLWNMISPNKTQQDFFESLF